MRIGVDATCWHNRRGYGRHLRALLRALIGLDSSTHYTLVLDSTDTAEPIPEGCEARIVQSGVPTVQAASAAGSRSLADMGRMSRALSSRDFDMVLFPTIYSFVPVFTRARKLVMVHDVIAETFPKLTVPRFSARLFWNAKVAVGRFQADALITVSEYSRSGILKRFKMDPDRVFVVGEAADPVFRRLDRPAFNDKLRAKGIDPSGRIITYLGGFSPHKNLEALMGAFSRIAVRPEFQDVQLVMVGDTSGDSFFTYFGTIQAQVNSLGLQNRVVFTGYLDDDDVVLLLNLSTVLVLPSLMEGFGLPAVEAAACGCPVIATTASPLPALLGGGGIFIDTAEDSIVGALERVLPDEALRLRMRSEGMAAASRLTWERSARQMMDIVRTVAGA